MRKVIATVCASLILLGAIGCGAPDPAKSPDFKKENINPNNVKMPVSKGEMKDANIKGASSK